MCCGDVLPTRASSASSPPADLGGQPVAEPIITPSLIMSTTLSAFMLFRKKILLAFV